MRKRIACILFVALFLTFTVSLGYAAQEPSIRPLVHRDTFDYPTCEIHNCTHTNLTERGYRNIEYEQCDSYYHTKLTFHRAYCGVCGCLASGYTAEEQETHDFQASTSTRQGTSSSQHWDIVTTTQRCSECGYSKSSESTSNYANHYSTSNWSDGGHSGAYHYFYRYCDTCGYRFDTLKLECPGNGSHVTIQNYRPPLVTE